MSCLLPRPVPLALAISLAFSAGAALAQNAPPPAAMEAAREINISAQPLGDALNAWARQTRMQVAVQQSLVAGKTAPAVSGNLTPRQALNRLLAGSGLEASIDGSEVIVRPAAGSSSSAATLADVVVTGKAERADGLPEAYAGGQVARGGQVGMLGNKDVMDTPFSSTNYTSKTIEDQQARTLVDVMANESSVVVGAKSGGRNDFWSFRGFPVQTYGASNSLNGLPGMAPLQFASTDFIERVEVLRGPNALLKGTAMTGHGALAGTVNLVTKRAGDEPLTQLETRYMSDSQFGAHADVGRRFGESKEFGIRFNGSGDSGDTPVDTQHSKFGTAALNLDYRGDRVRLSADLAHQTSRLNSPGSTMTINGVAGVLRSLSQVPAAPDNSTPFSPSWAEGAHDVTLGMVQVEVDIQDNVTAYAAVGTQRYTSSATDDDLLLLNRFGAVGIRPATYRDQTDVFSTQGGLNARLKTGSVGHALSFNAARIEYDRDSTLLSRAGAGAGTIIPVGSLYNPVFPATPVYPPYQAMLPTSEVKSSSVAFADTMSFLDERIQLTAGARYNEIESKAFSSGSVQSSAYDSSAWSPAFGLVVKPWQHVSLYASYIEALELGSIVGRTYANAGEVFPPYTSKQYETGIKADWGAVMTTLAVFQIAQPLSMSVPSTTGGLPTLTQDGEQRNRGVELAAYGELSRSVRLLSGATYIEATQTKNDNGRDGWRAAATPRFRAVVGGEWDTPFIEGLTLTGRLTYTGNVATINSRPELTVPSWTQVDLGARYRLKSSWTRKPVEIRFGIDNVFDKSYWKVAHPTSGNLMKSDARTFRLSATFDF